ncbi:hypothetical protein AB6C98_07475 [Vibrio splendidus]
MDESISGVLSYWNLKKFQSEDKPLSILEFPLYTDSHIIGELKDGKSPYKLLNMIANFNNQEVVKDALTLRVNWYIDSRASYKVQTDTTRYHGGWVTDELASLISLRLGIRVKAGQMTRSFDCYSNDPLGQPCSTREKAPQVNIKVRGAMLPNAVKTVDIAEVDNIHLLGELSECEYIALVRSARMYQEALWVAESEPELAWLMLISAVETAANHWSSEKESPVERLRSAKPELAKILLESGGETLLKNVALEIAPTLGSTNKFIKFCLHFMPKEPEKRPIDCYQVKWSKTGFKVILNKLYGYRSQALHGGIPFPAPLCTPPELIPHDSYTEKGGTGLATHTLGASWESKDLPITMNTFNHFVHGVLNNWWCSLLRSGG